MSLPIENVMAKGRLVTIDALRGTAALSIAVAHVSGNIVMTFEQMSGFIAQCFVFSIYRWDRKGLSVFSDIGFLHSSKVGKGKD